MRENWENAAVSVGSHLTIACKWLVLFKFSGLELGIAADETEDGAMSDGAESMKDLINFVAKTLVDQTDRVEINEIAGSQTNVIELKVAKEDVGKVIGRNGRTADAIRTILNCGAAKLNKRYILHIVDE